MSARVNALTASDVGLERLRSGVGRWDDQVSAANELDRLRAEVAALRDRVVRVADQAAINAREVERMRLVIEATRRMRSHRDALDAIPERLQYLPRYYDVLTELEAAVDDAIAAVVALDAGEQQ